MASSSSGESSSSGTSSASLSASRNFNDGQNYRVIQGTRRNSRIFVQDNFLYILDKIEDSTTYLKCKYETCSARAVIKDQVLSTPNLERAPHCCEGRQQLSLVKLASIEALTKMKKRAATEGTSLFVSRVTTYYWLKVFVSSRLQTSYPNLT